MYHMAQDIQIDSVGFLNYIIKKGWSALIVYGCGNHLCQMLKLHSDLAVLIERLIDKDEKKTGSSILPCLPLVEPYETLLIFPPKTEIVISETEYLEEAQEEIRHIREDLKLINIDEVWQHMEIEKCNCMLAKERSHKLSRAFWTEAPSSLLPFAPFRESDVVISENPDCHGRFFYGMPVCSPNVLDESIMPYFTIVCSSDYDRVKSLLLQRGYKEYENFSHISKVRWHPENVLDTLRLRLQSQSIMQAKAGIKVSVIMPSLNVASYIRQAVESVMRQTLKDIEIICVDAGSTDGTLEILEKLAERDRRISIIRSDMKSYGHQINLGIDAAKGQYIGIMETDDWVLPQMYEEEYLAAQEQNVDFLRADRYIFRRDGIKGDEHEYLPIINSRDQQHLYGKVFDPSKEMQAFYWGPNTTSGIVKRDFLKQNKIRLNESPGASYQDNGLFFQVMIHAQRVMVMPRAYYMIRRDRAESSAFDKNNTDAMSGEMSFVKQVVSRSGKEILWETFYRIKYGNYLWRLQNILPEYQRDYLGHIVEEFHHDVASGDLPQRLMKYGVISSMQKIASDPEKYYREKIIPKQEFEQSVITFNQAIIYGDRNVVVETIRKLRYVPKPIEIIACIIAVKREEETSIKGIPLCNFDDLMEYKNDAVVIVAVSAWKWPKVEKKIRAKGFKHIILKI